MTQRRFPFLKVYCAAIILAAITLYGLLSALLGNGLWDAASWCALAIPLCVIIAYVVKSYQKT
ncbi:hypothetical protein [Granulicella sp. dw_53]|uniref:hypothetical protein n=1 Tax=Granulicella sp. dw_53 TaxID=2719792 RepID=UPI001BD2856A|nr:hypothetical protein [Granulicella sp. dw_53]